MMKHCRMAIQKLEKKLLEISDPRNSNYGKHLTLEELKASAPIPNESVEIVKSFLHAYDVKDISVNHNQDMIEVKLPVAIAESMFQTKLHLFSATGKFGQQAFIHRATGPYSLPLSVAQVVEFVGDLHYFPTLRHPKVYGTSIIGRGSWENDCDGLFTCRGLITPGVLIKRYSISSDDSPVLSEIRLERKLGSFKNSMAVAEFQGQYFDDADLKKFSNGCHVNVTVDKIIGGDLPVGGLESLLDIEYIKALAPEIPLAFVYSDEYSLLSWAKQISDDEDPQYVHSVSYGNDEHQQISDDYIFAVNVQLMKAGLRGLSILFASGDQGVCGREGCRIFSRKFKPDFPAGSPYVTAVGGTDFLGSTIGEEQAWNCGGGGFSNYFGIPDYQKREVDQYKEDPDADLPEPNFWNASGRGYPDVSALGGQKTPYCVVARQMELGIAGTSASAPVVAAIFAKLNGVRSSMGKPPLGFLNPFIYQNAKTFNDVTNGRNGCSVLTKGFKAIGGWDPATGVGTPNYRKLRDVVRNMER